VPNCFSQLGLLFRVCWLVVFLLFTGSDTLMSTFRTRFPPQWQGLEGKCLPVYVWGDVSGSDTKVSTTKPQHGTPKPPTQHPKTSNTAPHNCTLPETLLPVKCLKPMEKEGLALEGHQNLQHRHPKPPTQHPKPPTRHPTTAHFRKRSP